MADVLSNYVKFMRGTPTAFNNLAEKDPDTLYFVSVDGEDVGQLWIGSKLITMSTTEDGLTTYLNELEDVDTAGVADGNFLGWDTNKQLWVPMSLAEALTSSIMTGASSTTDGAAGAVPAPKAGEEGYFLRGDGTWAEVDVEPKTQVFEKTLAEGQTHDQAITEVTSGAILRKGDIVIIKEFIATEVKGDVSEDKYSYTSYVYNGTKFVAMDGNYNAKNVYFDQDFVFTKAIGTVTIPSSGSKTVDAEGKNIYDFFAGLFAAESDPSVTKPSISAFSMTKTGAYEAGTVVTGITYASTFEDGKYSYGPEPTGSTATSWSIKDNAGNVVGTTEDGSVPDITVTDTTNFYLRATATYSNGSYGLTNLGNTSTKRITAGTTDAKTSGAITGYRNSFYGTLNDTTTELTSDVIRGLTKTGSTMVSGSTFTLEIPATARRAIIALPAGVSFTATHQEGLNAPVESSFNTKLTVSVAGATAESAIDYDVYVAGFAGTASGTNHYDVTIV